MRRYRMERTTTGHKYMVRMADDEVAGKILYNIALVTIPFFASALMFLLWIKVGG